MMLLTSMRPLNWKNSFKKIKTESTLRFDDLKCYLYSLRWVDDIISAYNIMSRTEE